jgi:hypothetical protein
MSELGSHCKRKERRKYSEGKKESSIRRRLPMEVK